jgi:hypothetical protein
MPRALVLIAVASAAFLAAQARGQPVCYRLTDASTYTEGCLPPCLCPILAAQPLGGTFELEQTNDFGTVIEYEVRNVRFRVDGYAPGRIFEGRGRYTRISGFAGWDHQMELSLSVDGEPPVRFDSGLVSGGGEFPAVDIALARNGFYCYDIVLDLHARPGRCRCSCEMTGDECVDVHDLLAYLDLWFASDASADLDEHAGVDVGDLLTFLDAWFNAAGTGCP